jgi:hypothetical protein
MKGCIEQLTAMLAEVMKDEYMMMFNIFDHRSDSSQSEKEIENYNKLKDFKEHLKLSINVIIEDIYNNFPSYIMLTD